MKDEEVLDVILDAYKSMIPNTIKYSDKKKQNSDRDREFIKRINLKITNYFTGINEINSIVFSRGIQNKFYDTFHSEEFLFDIHACKYSVNKRQGISSVCNIISSLIAIESEFTNRINGIVKDFNKLVCSNAPFKLMILRKTDMPEKYIKPLEMIISDSKLSVYILLIPHPNLWNCSFTRPYLLYKYKNGQLKEKQQGKENVVTKEVF